MRAGDVELGRLVVSRGLLPRDVVRAVYAQLAPGETLAAALVARGLVASPVVSALLAELGGRAAAPHAGRGPTGSGAADATFRAAPGTLPPDGADATFRTAPGALPPGAAGPTSRAQGGESGAPPSAAPSGLPRPGDVVGGRYEVLDLLGKGGMGAVFRARDPDGHVVALKVLLAGDAGEAAVARFEREAQAAARVDDHPGVVRVRALGTHAGLPFAVMDFVEGSDLRALLRAGLPLADGLRIVEAVARAVEHCHRRGVVHRDLKPANVLVRTSDGAPLVADFGLALDLSAERLTRTGEVMGTLAYMPPEQADGRKDEVDARSDVYALGAVLYEVATGSPPFQGDTHQVLKRLFLDPPAPVRSLRPDAPDALDAVCQRALAKERAARYASAGDLADDVGRLRRGEPVAARRPSRREVLRWRLRRRDPRVVYPLGLACAALVLAAGGLATAGLVAGRARAAREALARDLGPGLAGRLAASDPLSFETSRTLATDVLTHLRAYDGAPADGAAEDDAARARALRALVRSLAASGGAAAGIHAGSDATSVLRAAGPEPGDNLARLARRLSLAPGVDRDGPPPPGAAGALEGDDGRSSPEDRLVAALRLLGWNDPPGADVPEADAARARALLEALAGGEPRPVAGAARRALAAADAAAPDARAAAAAALAATPAPAAAADEVTAALTRYREGVARAEKARALRHALATRREALAASARAPRSPGTYEAVATLLARIHACASEAPALAPAERAQLEGDVVDLVAAAFLTPYSGFDVAGLEALLAFVERTHAEGHVDWTAPRLLAAAERPVQASLQLPLGVHRETLPLDTLMAVFRLGPRVAWSIESFASAYAPEVERRTGAPGASGDLHLLRALQIPAARGADADDPRVVAHLAAALGADLGPDMRERLGLAAHVPGGPPLTPAWRTFARYRLARRLGRATFSDRGEIAPALAADPRLRARLEVLAAVLLDTRARFAELPRDVLGFCTDAWRPLALLGEALAPTDPALAARLTEASRSVVEEGCERAWRAVRGEPQPDDVLVENEARQVAREVAVLEMGAIEQALARGAPAEAVAGSRDVHDLAAGRTVIPGLDLAQAFTKLVEVEAVRASTALELGDVVEAAASADAVRVLHARYERAGTPPEGLDSARCTLALVRLRAGDAAGARALLEEARAAGPLRSSRWRDVLAQVGP